MLKHILSGILPVNKVPLASKHVRLSRSPKPEGKVPMISFLPLVTSRTIPRNLKDWRLANAAIWDGIVPVNKLNPRSHFRSPMSCPISEGIVPDKLLPPKFKDSSDTTWLDRSEKEAEVQLLATHTKLRKHPDLAGDGSQETFPYSVKASVKTNLTLQPQLCQIGE